MKGDNELRLNQATMIEAIQLWVEATFKARLRVKSVHESGGQHDGFTVIVESMPDDPGANGGAGL